MKKRLMMLLCLALLVGVMPAAAVAATTVTQPLDLTTQATVDKLSDEGWAWDKDSKTLTLNGLNLSVVASPAITAPADTTIVLVDSSQNSITMTNAGDVGILSYGNLTVKTADNSANKGSLKMTENANNTIGMSLAATPDSFNVTFAISNVDLDITARRGIQMMAEGNTEKREYAMTLEGVDYQFTAATGVTNFRSLQVWNDKNGDSSITLKESTVIGDGDITCVGEKISDATIDIIGSDVDITGSIWAQYADTTLAVNIEKSIVKATQIKVNSWNQRVDLARLDVNDSTVILGPITTTDGAIEVGCNHATEAEVNFKKSKIVAVNTGKQSGSEVKGAAISVSRTPHAGETYDTARGTLTMENTELFVMGARDFDHAETNNHDQNNHVTCVVYPSVTTATSSADSMSVGLPANTVFTSEGITYTVTNPATITLDTANRIMSLPAGTELKIHENGNILVSSEGVMIVECGHAVQIPGDTETTVTLADGSTVKLKPAADAFLYVDEDETIDVPAGTTVQVGGNDPVVAQIDSILKDGKLIPKNQSLVLPTMQGTIGATYGNELTLTVRITKVQTKSKMSATAQDTVQFYYGNTLLGQSPVTYTDNTKNSGTATLTYDTAKKIIPVGTQIITVKYGGSKDMAANISQIPVQVAPKKLTVTGLTAVDRNYNGSTAVSVTGGTLTGMLPGDEVAIGAITANTADPNGGKEKPVAISAIALTGKDSGWYTANLPLGVTVSIFSNPPKTGDTNQPLLYMALLAVSVAGLSMLKKKRA